MKFCMCYLKQVFTKPFPIWTGNKVLTTLKTLPACKNLTPTFRFLSFDLVEFYFVSNDLDEVVLQLEYSCDLINRKILSISFNGK